MSDANPDSTPTQPRQRKSGTRDTRFDPPHEVARGDDAQQRSLANAEAATGEAPSRRQPALAGVQSTGALPQETSATFPPEIPPTASAVDDMLSLPPAVMQQFRTQAQQLAKYLDDRQRDLDRREAQLNAQIAQQEAAQRSARLWFQEREAELAARETELAQCEAELAEKQRRLNSREVTVESRERELDRNAQRVEKIATVAQLSAAMPGAELEIQDDQLLPAAAPSLRHDQLDLDDIAEQLARREENCAILEHKLEDMLKRVATVDAMLTRGQIELEEDRRRLEAERAALHAELDIAQKRLADERLQQESQHDARNQTLTERTEQLELRASAVEQLRAEVLRIQRETLETRLATEELCAQLYGDTPPAALLQSIAQMRAKIAADFKLQSSEIEAQREEAQKLLAQMLEQHKRLIEQKQEFAENSLRQQRELENQAARLSQRENYLRQEQQQLERLRFQWQSDRRHLEIELARLQSELGRKLLAESAGS